MNYVITVFGESEKHTKDLIKDVKSYLFNMYYRVGSSLERYKVERTKKTMFEVHLYCSPNEIKEVENLISGETAKWELNYG